MEEADLALAAALEATVAAGQAEKLIPAVALEAYGRTAHLLLEHQAHTD